MNHYRMAFWAALGASITLLAVVVGLWWHWPAGASAPVSPASGVPSAAAAAASPASLPAADVARAPVKLFPQRLQSIGVRTGVVERRSVEDRILTTGNVAIDETRLAYVQARFSGYIQKVFVDATYRYVRKNQPLFTIYSPDLVATERELLVATRSQHELSHSTDPEVHEDARSLVDAAAQRLRQWDIPEREIERLESSGEVRQNLEIDSPVSGYITEREALPNKYVQPDTRLYTVADLSRIWVFAQVFQNDLGRLRVGDAATLTVDAHPGRTFAGRVDFIYPDIDMMTRTARVRLTLPNPHLELVPGMFVNVSLDIPLGDQLVIPATGVLQTGTHQIVFVDRGQGSLEPREVDLGARVGDAFIVHQGLAAGDRIVTSANFLIDSESQLQAALGTFSPPAPGPVTTPTAAAPQATVQFSTDPAPPQRGSNLVHVKLLDANGAPVAGARVSVTLFMPAMPSMGMAAMRVPVELAEKGHGTYQGRAELQRGGTWQVTILAQKDGQAIAMSQVAVSATGGM